MRGCGRLDEVELTEALLGEGEGRESGRKPPDSERSMIFTVCQVSQLCGELRISSFEALDQLELCQRQPPPSLMQGQNRSWISLLKVQLLVSSVALLKHSPQRIM